MSATKHDWKRYGDLEFEDGIETSEFMVEVSEQLWGEPSCFECEEIYNCDCEDRCEPYTIEESIARLKEFSEKALAWDNLTKFFNAPPFESPHIDDDTQTDWDMRELISSIMNEVKE